MGCMYMQLFSITDLRLKLITEEIGSSFQLFGMHFNSSNPPALLKGEIESSS